MPALPGLQFAPLGRCPRTHRHATPGEETPITTPYTRPPPGPPKQPRLDVVPIGK